ncbi:MAG: response regulator [Deltaproteobacteria bacterium]|nr:response regulator [Deltaproteobacteria bacterium]
MADTILIVDDTPFMRKIVSLALNAVGYDHIDEAHNAVDAIFMLTHGVKPMLIITGAHMPPMDGLPLAKRIKEIPRHSGTPILAITSTCSGSAACTDCHEIGADALLKKPFTVKELYDVVGNVVSEKYGDVALSPHK